MKVIKKIESQSFVISYSRRTYRKCCQVLQFINHTDYQKHNRKEGRKFITQNNVLYKIDLKLFETPAITMGIIYLVSTQNFPVN